MEGGGGSREGGRLEVQWEGERWRKGEVQPGRQVELALGELPEDVPGAVRGGRSRVVLRCDELRGGEAPHIAGPDLERHRRAGAQVDHRVHCEGPAATRVAEVLGIQGSAYCLARC